MNAGVSHAVVGETRKTSRVASQCGLKIRAVLFMQLSRLHQQLGPNGRRVSNLQSCLQELQCSFPLCGLRVGLRQRLDCHGAAALVGEQRLRACPRARMRRIHLQRGAIALRCLFRPAESLAVGVAELRL
jgi:hypothetical protein